MFLKRPPGELGHYHGNWYTDDQVISSHGIDYTGIVQYKDAILPV